MDGLRAEPHEVLERGRHIALLRSRVETSPPGETPDDVGSKPPPIGLEGEGHAPRDAHKVLRLQAGLSLLSAHPTGLAVERLDVFPTGVATPLRIVCVAVPEVEPERSVVPQHAADLAEDFNEMRDVEVGRRLQAEHAAPGPAGAERAHFWFHRGAHGALMTSAERRVPFKRASPFRSRLNMDLPCMRAPGLAAPHARREAVVSEAPVGRGGDDALDGPVGERERTGITLKKDRDGLCRHQGRGEKKGDRRSEDSPSHAVSTERPAITSGDPMSPSPARGHAGRSRIEAGGPSAAGYRAAFFRLAAQRIQRGARADFQRPQPQ